MCRVDEDAMKIHFPETLITFLSSHSLFPQVLRTWNSDIDKKQSMSGL